LGDADRLLRARQPLEETQRQVDGLGRRTVVDGPRLSSGWRERADFRHGQRVLLNETTFYYLNRTSRQCQMAVRSSDASDANRGRVSSLRRSSGRRPSVGRAVRLRLRPTPLTNRGPLALELQRGCARPRKKSS